MTNLSQFGVPAGRLRSGLCGLLALPFLWACEDEVMAPPLVPAPSADRAVAIAATDREALVAFYNATDGPNWEA